MTNPTSNFGWQMPTSTDLVTDLPADFETFGQAVDTSLADLKGGTTGQILSKASNTDMDFTWVANDVGDITAVTAGTGITGGGTSGAVTVSFDQANFGGGQFAAGKNKIVNGNFAINQRSFTSTTSSLAYTFDRWQTATSGGTATYSAQTFTPGAAPVAGYEGRNFTRIVTTGQSGSTNFTGFQQKIEDVRTLAGQSATISFWAKAASGTPKISIVTEQSFGTGGTPSGVVTTLVGEVTLSTSWVRYSVTGTVPSISGKTIGTNNDSALVVELYVSVGSGLTAYGTQGLQANTFDIWGVQTEAGSVATPFQTATGTIQGELAACQRYYFRLAPGGANSIIACPVVTPATTSTTCEVRLPVTMRSTISLDYSSIYISDGTTAFTTLSSVTSGANTDTGLVNVGVASGLTQFRPYHIQTLTSSGYLGFSAEI